MSALGAPSTAPPDLCRTPQPNTPLGTSGGTLSSALSSSTALCPQVGKGHGGDIPQFVCIGLGTRLSLQLAKVPRARSCRSLEPPPPHRRISADTRGQSDATEHQGKAKTRWVVAPSKAMRHKGLWGGHGVFWGWGARWNTAGVGHVGGAHEVPRAGALRDAASGGGGQRAWRRGVSAPKGALGGAKGSSAGGTGWTYQGARSEGGAPVVSLPGGGHRTGV